MILKNIKRYFPENQPHGREIAYFQSEDGLDFYENMDKFKKKYKFCIDPKTNVIYSFGEDIDRLFVDGFTIVEADEIPEDFSINGTHYFDMRDGKVKAIPIDYVALANNQRNKLIEIARTNSSDLKSELDLGIISDEDKEKLKEYMIYIRTLKSLDLNYVKNQSLLESIDWPKAPE